MSIRDVMTEMRALEFIRDHVTFKLPYDFSYHMKTPLMCTLQFCILSLIKFLILNKIPHIITILIIKNGQKNPTSFMDGPHVI